MSASVPQHRFGRTGLTIPHVVLGAGWVGGLIIRADRQTRFAQLDGALAAGVDWIDTAAQYGKGASETAIGEWLAARDGPRPRISTKFSVDPAQSDMAGQMRRSVEASFTRLGVEKVEAILLHNQVLDGVAESSLPGVTVANVLDDGGIRDAMEGLKADGLCDHLGFTGLGDPAAVKALAASGRFDLAQIYYNMLNPTAGGPAPAGWNSTDFLSVLDDCAAADMGVMGIRIFAGGHLATAERHGREIPLTANAEDRAEEARAAAAFGALGDEDGSHAQLAMRFGLAEGRLSTIVVGIGEDWHFAHALEALELGPLGETALARLADVRARHAAFVG